MNYANQVIPVIRANDPNNIIVVGTADGSAGPWFPPSQRLNYNNIMYTLHIYPDLSDSDNEQIRASATTAFSSGTPIFVTEYGVGRDSTLAFDEMTLWYKYLDQYFISRATWSMCDMPEIFSAITNGSTISSTPAAQVGAIVANSAYFTENGIFVNQQFQNLGILFKMFTKPH